MSGLGDALSSDFLKDFNKSVGKVEGVTRGSRAPRYWISLGNYVINKVVSGRYRGGIPQGKLAMLSGPASAGKSFLICNAIREAQALDMGVLVIDSEHALDFEFMEAIGVDTTREDFAYTGVTTIAQRTKILSSFTKAYKNANEEKQFLIVFDSLDGLLTDSALEAYESGDIKGEMGQKVLQTKKMVLPLVNDLKNLNISFLCTKQVYKSQDPIEAKNPVTEYKMSDSIKYPFSQIVQVSRLFLKNETTKKYDGIRLKVFGLKTRFGKPFQQAVVEVPYDTGMDPFNGLLEVAEYVGVVSRAGAWYEFDGKKFQSKNFHLHQEDILEALIALENKSIDIRVDENEELVLEEDKEMSEKETLKSIIEKKQTIKKKASAEV